MERKKENMIITKFIDMKILFILFAVQISPFVVSIQKVPQYILHLLCQFKRLPNNQGYIALSNLFVLNNLLFCWALKKYFDFKTLWNFVRSNTLTWSFWSCLILKNRIKIGYEEMRIFIWVAANWFFFNSNNFKRMDYLVWTFPHLCLGMLITIYLNSLE